MRKSTADTSNQSVLGADQRHKILIISAVAAHHGPTPAFQTIKLDRVCVGSILKGSRHSGDGQKACCRGFQKCTIFTQQTGPSTKSLAQIQPPTLTLDPKLINVYAEVLHLCIETIG